MLIGKCLCVLCFQVVDLPVLKGECFAPHLPFCFEKGSATSFITERCFVNPSCVWHVQCRLHDCAYMCVCGSCGFIEALLDIIAFHGRGKQRLLLPCCFRLVAELTHSSTGIRLLRQSYFLIKNYTSREDGPELIRS